MQKFHILMMCHYPYLGSASDWSCCEGNLLQPIKNMFDPVLGRNLSFYGISVLISQSSSLFDLPIRQKSFNYM